MGATTSPTAAQNQTPPWEELPTGGIGSAAVGQGFNVNEADLQFILEQILISEAHAGTGATATAAACSSLIGPGPNQIPAGPNAHLLHLGLRTIDGQCNNLLPGQEDFGAADRPFPRLTTAEYRAEYGTSGAVTDPEPRRISNLIVDQTPANPAAVTEGGGEIDSDGSHVIENVAPDEGLSAPFNTVFSLFGQFFDHGLDLTTRNGATVTMPLDPDDPLYDPGAFPFPVVQMDMTRASIPGGEPINQTTPYVDQQQTYGSHATVHVFLREYETNLAGDTVSNGFMLRGPGGGLATWETVKTQTSSLLGIQLTDSDVHNVPLLLTDPYGRYVRGPGGYPQMVSIGGGLTEGDPTANGGAGVALPLDVERTGHAFLVDIAHSANPPKPGEAANGHDGALLNDRYIAGDGRVNENIGLTAVHHVFHSEHNRLVGHIQDVLTAGDPANLPSWQTGTEWNGERIVQAARFVTEMEYQHLAFEEFARKVQPNVNVFDAYDATIDAAITVEYSQAAYRFGHSMLRADLLRFDTPPFQTPNEIDLITAFLNPREFTNGAGGPLTPEEAAGTLFRGATTQVGNEIDEFVLPTLRSNLVGLPLDLASLNIARGRDYGIKPLNGVRRDLFAITGGNPALEPYTSWNDFALSMNNPGGLTSPSSLVNFVAAYGTHPTILSETTTLGRRAAAQQLLTDAMNNPTGGEADFMSGINAWANTPAGLTITGVDEIDLWMGGLAEKNQIAGGMLGDTLNYIFETQLEMLQEGDRFYYLPRTAGMNLLVQLEGNSFSELIERNTTAGNLPADVFSRPTYYFDAAVQGSVPGTPIVNDPNTDPQNEPGLLTRDPNGTIRYAGAEHTNWAGDDNGADRIASGAGDDTIRGNGGDDRLDGGDGADNLIGGNGNDILTDPLGDEDIKGGDGHDAINSGNGFDLNQGGRGNDYITGSTDPKEILAGPGNDLVRGGDSADEVHGDDGDDWLEGAAQSDNLEGDSGLPLLTGVDVNDPGDDVLNGDGGNDRLFGEGGNDVLVLNTGVERAFGQLGFDWATHYNDPLPGASDLLDNALVIPGVDVVDRFLQVEGLSGWDRDDDLRGDDTVQADLLGHELLQSGLDNIDGLAAVLPTGVTTFDTGNIMMGGRGSDLLEGRGGDDVIDGDAWLTVQLLAPPPGGGAGSQLVDSLTSLRVDLMAGNFNGGDISIVRKVETAACACTDTALYSGPVADYDIVVNGTTATIDHARGDGLLGDPLLDNGTDFLRNVEFAQFADDIVSLAAPVEQFSVLSFTGDVVLPGGVVAADEDVVSLNSASGAFAVVFDGSAQGVGALDVDGVASAGDTLLLSFNVASAVPGIAGTVDDSDIVSFDLTTNTFTPFFDGSLVGLSNGGEDVDAIEVLDDGTLLVSTTGGFNVAGVSGSDEDVLAFTPATPGDYSTGTWALHLDGGAVDLNAGGEDIDGAYVENADLRVTTTGNFSVAGGTVTGADEDIFSCDGLVSPATCAGFSSILDGTAVGIPGGADIDAIDVLGDPPPPPTPAASVDDVTLAEGDTGTTPFDFTVSLDAAPAGPVSVQVDTADGTALAGSDYTAITGLVLNWAPGDPLSQTVTVDVNGDTDVEPDQDFFVNLTVSSGDVTIGDGQGTGTIVDDDGVAPLMLTIDDVSQAEGDTGTTAFDFTVSLDAVPSTLVTVVIDTADGSATAGADYTEIVALALSWNPGDPVSQTVTVDVTGDPDVEPNENFFVNLSSPVGAAITDGQGEGTIINDDAAVGALTYMSFSSDVTLPGGLVITDEDIVSLDTGTGAFTLLFDGSANGAGATGLDVDAVKVIDPNTIAMSFNNATTLPGIGAVDDSDIVTYNTGTGQYTLFFDGSLAGLSTGSEDIDAIDILTDGTLLVSTTGGHSVPGVSGSDEDIIAFTPTNPGDYTTGTWATHLDGSILGLSDGGEDTNGIYTTGTDIHITTIGNFNIAGASGADEDIFSCNGHTAPSTCTGFTVILDGTTTGIPSGAEIDAISN